MLIPIWNYDRIMELGANKTKYKVGTKNSILQVNLKRPETKFAKVKVPDGKGGYKEGVYRVKTYDSLTDSDVVIGTFSAIKPTAVITVNADSAKFSKFELESVAFVTRNSKKETGTFRVLMTCNKQEWKVKDKDEKGKMCDAVVELSNAKDVMLKL